MTILIDFDNTIADWHSSIIEQLPDIEFDLSKYDLRERYFDRFDEVEKIFLAPGFTLNLKPYPRAIETILKMQEKHPVFICSAIHQSFIHTANEKLLWVKKHLGDEWVHRTILTYDKTLVHGDILLDDKPRIEGLNPLPSWQHIVYGKDVRDWDEFYKTFIL